MSSGDCSGSETNTTGQVRKYFDRMQDHSRNVKNQSSERPVRSESLKLYNSKNIVIFIFDLK